MAGDSVNHPGHYNQIQGVECIDVVEQMNFNRGNAIKYIWRAGSKGSTLAEEVEDLRKAIWYIRREIERIERDAHARGDLTWNTSQTTDSPPES